MKISLLTSLFAAWFGLAFCPATKANQAAEQQPPAAAKAPPTRAALAVTRDARGGQLLATCEIEGKPVNMIVDTGATHTSIDETFVRENLPSLPVSEITTPYRTNAPKPPKMVHASLLVDPLFVDRHPMLLLDFSGANSILHTPVQGVLGMNTMGCLPFVLNVRDKIFRFDTGLKHAPGMVKLRGRVDESNRLVIEARAKGGKSYDLLLDTGASATMLTAAAWQGGKGETVPLDSASIKGRTQEQAALATPTDMEIGDGLILRGVTPMLVGECLSNDAQTVGLLGLDSLGGIELYYFPPTPGKPHEPSGFYARKLDAPQP